ncbi:DNA-binding response regulator [Sphingobacterium alkalisoli]|nr:DNA-binding response regulator [Sphingobacterium alkalisoli]
MKAMDQYQIFVVDDHQLFLDGMIRILEDEADFAIAAFFNNGNEVLHALNRTIPDLIILDVQMSGIDGISLCEEVKRRFPEIKVLFISMFEQSNVILNCKTAGAEGFLPKTSDAAIVKDTIRKIIRGETVYLKNTEKLEKKKVIFPTSIFLLSNREKEIIRLIKSGNTSKTIADILSISEYTVQTHRKNIFKKLGLVSMSELIAFAYDNGL